MLDPEVETRPWDEQFALDDRSYRTQLAYLLERSPFYREKLAGLDAGGLAEIARLPLTDKDDLRAARTTENPIGRHLCAAPSELVRIDSTYNAGPFAAGAALAAFERIGLTHIPVGIGNSERLLQAIRLLRPEAVVLTPSYAAHLAERNPELASSSVRRVLVAGEPGGGEARFRANLEQAWGAKGTEAVG